MEYTIPETMLISAVGIGLVFAVLVVLLVLISVISSFIRATKKKKDSDVKDVPVRAARGSCGEVSIFDVPDKTAAMVMAIVADQMGAPLNELRFLSIKEVKNDEI